jgi:hypothetical protein
MAGACLGRVAFFAFVQSYAKPEYAIHNMLYLTCIGKIR